jgi:hypothetical protein
MRRATTSISSSGEPSASSSTNGNKKDGFSLRTDRKKRQQRRKRSRTTTASVSKWIFLLMSLFVLVDIMYLYNLSSKAPSKRDYHILLEQQGYNTTTVNNKVNNGNSDKGPILKILEQAGIDTVNDLDEKTLQALPTWSQVQRLFGDGPRIVGLERCQEFRESVDPSETFLSIAGTFNTGTNLISALMIEVNIPGSPLESSFHRIAFPTLPFFPQLA